MTAMFIITKVLIFPFITNFAHSAHCSEVFGISSVRILFYGLFVGMPLFFALVVALTIGRRGYKILRDGQIPPIDEKVFRPTRIQRGKKVKFVGYIHLLVALPFIAISLWGIPQAHKLSNKTTNPKHSCNTIPANSNYTKQNNYSE